MKRILLVFCLMLTVLCVTATEKVKVGNFWYEVNNDKTYATVIAAQQGEDSYSGSITIPSSIPVKVSEDPEEYVQVPVTVIGNNAFRNTTITDVTIPASITKIGSSAFDNCSYIEKATFASIQALCEMEFANYLSHPLSSSENGALFIGNSTTEEIDLVIPEGITRIRAYCFYNCKHITSVTIPSTLTTVGTNAFSRATGLKKVTFASEASLCTIDYDAIYSNPIYYAHNLYIGTTPLTNLTIPESSLKNGNTVKRYILAGATGLIKVVLPSAVKKIEPQAFEGCTGLQYADYANLDQVLDMDYSGSLTANPMYYAKQLLINNTFASNLTIEKDLKPGAFVNATWLVYVTIQEGVKHIGNSAFEGCANLSLVKLPSSLETIGEHAFWGCNSLSAPTLPNGLTSIGEGAFHDCKSGNFKNIEIPDNCTLGNEVFYRCTNLETVKLPADLTTIGNNSFDMCYNLKDIDLPATITTIGDFAFRDCRKLTKFPSGGAVTSIGKNAFTGCTGITSLILPEPMNTISENAFSGCENMTTLSLPASTTYINGNAFSGCTVLKDVFSLNTAAPSVANNSFGNLESGMTLYVADATAKTNYEGATTWKNFKTITVKEEHTLTFYKNDAEVKKISQDAGTVIRESDIPTPTLGEGDEFSGWSEPVPTTMPMENKNFYGYVSKVKEIDGYQYRLRPSEQLNEKNLPNRAELLAVKKKLTTEDKEITLSSTVTDGETGTSYNLIAIGDHAFQNQTIIQKITLPTSITSVGNAAFRGCTNMHTVNNFDGITVVNDSVFFNCPALVMHSLSDNITDIGRLAFGYCTNLDISILPSKLTNISTQAFAYSGIKNLIISENLEVFGDEIFKECKELETITFADGLSLSLPKLTFWNCTKLKEVTLVGSIGSIQEGAFQGCTGLTSLVIPEGISIIGNSAFKGCSQLKAITLPSSTDGINQKAFADCDALSQITINCLEAPFAESDAFSDKIHNTAWIYVQDVSKYNKKPWNSFTHITTKAEYKLTYKVDGVVKNEENIMVGTTIAPFAVPESTTGGTNFSGWLNLPDVMPAEDVIVEGNYKYEIKFYEGSIDEANRLLKNNEYVFYYGDKIVLPVESLHKAEQKYTLTGLTPDAIFEDNAADIDLPMPAKIINVIVTYEDAEVDYTYNSIKYKVFLLENHAEVIGRASTTGSLTIPASIIYNEKTYSVTGIQPEAFKNDTKLTSVNIDNSVQTIGDEAFKGCALLNTVSMSATLDSIGQQAFANTALTSVTVPYAAKMGKEIFYWCTKLKTISFSESLTILPERIFQNCLSLEQITIPEQITVIGDGAFAGCVDMSELTLKPTIQKLGEYAFYGAFDNNDKIVVEGTTLPTAYDNTFDDNAYEHALLETLANTTSLDGWKNFAHVEGSTSPQCAKPTIEYKGGKLKFTFDPSSFEPGKDNENKIKDGVTIISSITIDDTGENSVNEVELTKNYKVTAYAQKDGCRRSETVTKIFQFLNGDVNLDGEINITDAQLIVNKIVGKIDALAPKLDVVIEPEQDTLDPQ